MTTVPLRLTVLGSGTMMPTRTRRPAAYLIEYDTIRILLDIGHGTIASLVGRGIDLHSIRAIAFTHFHTDHFADVHPLIHARWVDDVTHDRSHRPLLLLGPKTLKRRLQKLRDVMWPEPAEGYPVVISEQGPRPGLLTLDVLQISTFPVRHVEWFDSVGYRLVAGAGSIAYTGDMHVEQGRDFSQGIEGAGLLLIEAGGKEGSRTHLSPAAAITLGARLDVGRIVLTHVREENTAEIRQLLTGREGLPSDVATRLQQHPEFVTLAEDGMVLSLS